MNTHLNWSNLQYFLIVEYNYSLVFSYQYQVVGQTMTSMLDTFGFGSTTIENDIEAAAIIQMQLSVLTNDSNAKGKEPEGSLSDRDMAIRLYLEDLEKAVTFFLDRAMARSIDDNATLTREMLAERLSEKERHMRSSPGKSSVSGIVVPGGSVRGSISRVFEDRDSAYAEVVYDDLPQAECSAWASSRVKNRQCVACLSNTPISQLVKIPCGQDYCGKCLESLFRRSMSDYTLFPPRCCRQHIPITAIRFLVSEEFVKEFEKKKAEFETPDKTYCSKETCYAFISTANIKGFRAVCPDCKTVTCSNCKLAGHEPSDCV